MSFENQTIESKRETPATSPNFLKKPCAVQVPTEPIAHQSPAGAGNGPRRNVREKSRKATLVANICLGNAKDGLCTKSAMFSRVITYEQMNEGKAPAMGSALLKVVKLMVSEGQFYSGIDSDLEIGRWFWQGFGIK